MRFLLAVALVCVFPLVYKPKPSTFILLWNADEGCVPHEYLGDLYPEGGCPHQHAIHGQIFDSLDAALKQLNTVSCEDDTLIFEQPGQINACVYKRDVVGIFYAEPIPLGQKVTGHYTATETHTDLVQKDSHEWRVQP